MCIYYLQHVETLSYLCDSGLHVCPSVDELGQGEKKCMFMISVPLQIYSNPSSLLAFTYSLTPSLTLLQHQPLISVLWAAGSCSVFIKEALGCFWDLDVIKVPRTQYEAGKVAGSATYKQIKIVWSSKSVCSFSLFSSWKWKQFCIFSLFRHDYIFSPQHFTVHV